MINQLIIDHATLGNLGLTGVPVSTEFSVGQSFLGKAPASYHVQMGGEGRGGEVGKPEVETIATRACRLAVLASGGASGGLVLPSPSLKCVCL